MDPTMESPIDRTVPLPPPFLGGVQIPIATGPHQYSSKNWVGKISLGHTPEQAFAALSTRAAPFQDGPSVDGGVVNIPGLGPVRQLADRDHLTIVNTTLPGHKLFPGNVFRSIVQDGDDLYVVTHGYGTGILPGANELVGPILWNALDLGVRSQLNPDDPTLRGYAMDEMNALVGDRPNGIPIGSLSGAANVGKPSASQGGTPGGAAPLGIISNQPMPDWPIPPPIFNAR